jgi:carbonic anhydrase
VRKLLRGIAEFRRRGRAVYAEGLALLAHGQKPDTLAIACSDSRISPVEFASSEPGDVFVLRNVGNLVPCHEPEPGAHDDSAGAGIEYALAVLPIRDVVVCGHSACGAIRAIHEGKVPPAAPHLSAWLEHGRRSLQGLPPAPPGLALLDHLSQQNVLRQIENLRTYPVVRDGERSGRVRLTAWWFDVARAELLDHDRDSNRFVPLDEERIERLIAELDGRRPA